MTAECLQEELVRAIKTAGLSEAVDRCQVLDLAGHFYVEIIVLDAAREQAVRDVATSLADVADASSLIVRSLWTIASIGEPVPAYGPDGGLRAAVLIPVNLLSGREVLGITVAVTKLAEWELDRILGRKTPMRDVAEVVVSNALRRGGQSYWNPRVDGYLEVGSSIAPQISRLLKKSA